MGLFGKYQHIYAVSLKIPHTAEYQGLLAVVAQHSAASIQAASAVVSCQIVL